MKTIENTKNRLIDYQRLFKDLHIEINPEYPSNDIGIAKLFHDIHRNVACYVAESEEWYYYNGKRWVKDRGSLFVMELCKTFALALDDYVTQLNDGSEESRKLVNYITGFHTRGKRLTLLADAKSVEPKSLDDFDCNKILLNCMNGTFNLQTFTLQPHNSDDYITKITKAKYDKEAVCPRWLEFIDEIMCGDADSAVFLQKANGYSLSGDTSHECFFSLKGPLTRNGKSTLMETEKYALGDYAITMQAQSLAHRSRDGAAASPDMARLKGARLVIVPEPTKGLDLNAALVKQFTGGENYVARNLNENFFEFQPEFKIFVNANNLPRISDDTVFASGRVHVIPFDRHYKPEEQDKSLKKLFRRSGNISGILNWMIEGYRLLLDEGLEPPQRIVDATAEYRQDADIFGQFLAEYITEKDGAYLSTSKLYKEYYVEWAKNNGYRPDSNQAFVGELRRRFWVRRVTSLGNVIDGVALSVDMASAP